MDLIESVFLQLLSLLYIELIWEREGDTDTVINVRERRREQHTCNSLLFTGYYYYIIIVYTGQLVASNFCGYFDLVINLFQR